MIMGPEGPVPIPPQPDFATPGRGGSKKRKRDSDDEESVAKASRVEEAIQVAMPPRPRFPLLAPPLPVKSPLPFPLFSREVLFHVINSTFPNQQNIADQLPAPADLANFLLPFIEHGVPLPTAVQQ